MLDPDEMRWLDEQLTGDVDHLLIGTSLPFMLPPGLHDLEAIDEVLAMGTHGRMRARTAPRRPRQTIDLEHWAAFNDGFVEVFDSVMEVARGERGRAAVDRRLPLRRRPQLLRRRGRRRPDAPRRPVAHRAGRLLADPQPHAARHPRHDVALRPRPRAADARFVAGHSKHVPDPAYPWQVTDGPWFDNCLAELTVQGRDLSIVWRGGEVRDGDDAHPVLTTVSSVRIPAATS